MSKLPSLIGPTALLSTHVDELPPHITFAECQRLREIIQDYWLKKKYTAKSEFYHWRDLLFIDMLWATGARVDDLCRLLVSAVIRLFFIIVGKQISTSLASAFTPCELPPPPTPSNTKPISLRCKPGSDTSISPLPASTTSGMTNPRKARRSGWSNSVFLMYVRGFLLPAPFSNAAIVTQFWQCAKGREIE